MTEQEFYDRYTPSDRSIFLSNLIANAAVPVYNVLSTFYRKLKELVSWLTADGRFPDRIETPEHLRSFAFSIQEREPSFAADLFAAANRAEEAKQ